MVGFNVGNLRKPAIKVFCILYKVAVVSLYIHLAEMPVLPDAIAIVYLSLLIERIELLKSFKNLYKIGRAHV